jgi:hypothetical protein
LCCRSPANYRVAIGSPIEICSETISFYNNLTYETYNVVIILGDKNVGKSTLLQRFVTKPINPSQLSKTFTGEIEVEAKPIPTTVDNDTVTSKFVTIGYDGRDLALLITSQRTPGNHDDHSYRSG